MCLQTDDASEMVSPCSCAGSLGSVHLKCLKSWVRERASLECEICKSKYIESLLPVLEPEAEAGAAQRTARRDTAAAAIAAAAARHAAAQQDRGPVWKTRKFWMYLFFITAVLGAVVCLLLLLGMRAGEELWAAIVLRVVAFGLPLFIIFRAMFACWQLRQIERQQLQSG